MAKIWCSVADKSRICVQFHVYRYRLEMDPVPRENESEMYRAILFDFGGVLTASVIESFARFSEEISGDRNLLFEILTQEPLAVKALADHEEGRLSHDDFENILARRLASRGVDAEPTTLISGMQRGLFPDTTMLNVVKLLKGRGVQVALVSNSLGRNCYDGFDLDSLFDVQAISGIEGVRKPSAELYEIACTRLGIRMNQAIMIDDLDVNIRAATELGLGGIVHSDAVSTVAQLARLLNWSLSEVQDFELSLAQASET